MGSKEQFLQPGVSDNLSEEPALDLVEIDKVIVGAHAILDCIVPLSRHRGLGAVRQMTARVEAEAHDRAEVFATTAAGSLASESGLMPLITVQQGDGPQVVRDYLATHPEVSALVLGAGADGNPGPLTTHFAGHAGHLPCVLMIVPGAIDDHRIDEVS